MTDKNVTQLTAASVFAASDLFYAVINGNSRKIAGSATFNLGAIALGGALLGTNVLAAAGTINFAGTLTMASGQIIVPNGSASAAGVSIRIGSDWGFSNDGSGGLQLSRNSNLYWYFGPTVPYFSGPSGAVYAWSNSTNAATTLDAGLSRLSAGVIGVGTGAQGSVAGIMQGASFQTTDIAVASLPTAAAGNKGQRRHVTDANSTTFGSTVAGGGANIVPVFSTGAAWIIA